MDKLPETAKGRGIVPHQLERTNNLIAKKMKDRKIDWAVNSS